MSVGAKNININVNGFKRQILRWEVKGYVVKETENDIDIECFIDMNEAIRTRLETTSVYRPISPSAVDSPIITNSNAATTSTTTTTTTTSNFQVIVNDSRSWNNRAPLFCSEDEEEDALDTKPASTPPIPVAVAPPVAIQAKRKPGRPKGSKNKKKVRVEERKEQIVEEEEEDSLACDCCWESRELVFKCKHGDPEEPRSCKYYLCVTCLKEVEEEQRGLCPNCRRSF
jgi:hypothetical protein